MTLPRSQSYRGWSLAGCALLAAAWAGLALTVPPIIAPPLTDIFWAGIGYLRSAPFYWALAQTTGTFLFGFLAAVVVAVILSILMCASRAGAGLLSPAIGLLNAVPGIAWMGLAIIWFGAGAGPTRFLVAVSCIPILVTALTHAYADCDPRLDELAQAYRMPMRTRLFSIVIPQLMGPTRAALLAMVGLGWKLTIMGEYISSANGIGRLLFDAKSNFQTDRVIALTLLIVATWALLDFMFRHATAVLLPVNRHGYIATKAANE